MKADGEAGAGPATPVRVLLVDDHTLFRRGLAALLARRPGISVVGDAADTGQALRLAQALQPDVILLDNHLPGVSGIDALPCLRAACPGARVMMLTVSEDEDDLVRALRAGADAYLLKTADGDDLADAVRRVAAGESVLAEAMTGKLIAAFRQQPQALPAAQVQGLAELSQREREILTAVGEGASNKEIARRFDIAESTVKVHVQHLLRKLSAHSRVQLAVIAASAGITAAPRPAATP
jgi:two-component system nitrate/nitrite response regulator NarL